MKNKLYFVLLALSTLLIFSCHWLKKQPKTPEEVAVAFSQALGSLDFDSAFHYCDSSTARLLEMMSSLVSGMPQNTREENRKKAKLLQTATCSINGDIATCQVCCDEKGVNIPEPVTLRLQEDGKWLVFIDKGNAPGDDAAAEEE